MFSTDKDKYHPTIKERNIVQPWMKRFNVDLKFEDYPMVFEAEYKGDWKYMRKLWEIFTYGKTDYGKNSELSERYWLALYNNAKLRCNQAELSNPIADRAIMRYHFNEEYEICKTELIDALQFFTNICDPETWDIEKFDELKETLYKLMKDNGKYQNYE